jgi:hypothetical protein
MRVHRVVVANGAHDACRAHFDGESGSLIVRSADPSVAPGPSAGQAPMPFAVVQGDYGKGFVHAIDGGALSCILTELDTASDLLGYLRERQTLFGLRHVMACGEEDVLGYYLLQRHARGRCVSRALPGPGGAGGPAVLSVREGQYRAWLASPHREAWLHSNESSYMVDELLNRSIGAWIAGTLTARGDPERTLRELASEGRLARRRLAAAVDHLVGTPLRGERATMLLGPLRAGGPSYVLLVLRRQPESLPEPEYRRSRQSLLAQCCLAARLRVPTARGIVGIAFGPPSDSQPSEDLCWADTGRWTDEDQASALRARDELGLFKDVRARHIEA